MTKITPLMAIVSAYNETLADILKAVDGLTDRQIRWQPNPDCHSMAFILWHIARWTDHLQATIPGMTEELAQRLPPSRQIWHQEQYAKRWGFEAAQLGYDETGTDADIVASGEPDWPAKEYLIDYAQQTFLAAERAISAIDEKQFEEIERQQYADEYMEASRAKTATVGNAVIEHLLHNAQHQGEMYYLGGLLMQAEKGQ